MNWQNIKALPIQFWLSLFVTLGSGATGAALTAQLTEIFGGDVAGKIAAVTGILSTIAGAILTFLSTQTALAKTVSQMPGVDPIQLNPSATPAMIALGNDKTQGAEKVLPPKT